MNNVLGTRLKELREESGLSMKQLAAAIEVSDAAICKWENGLAEPKAGYIARLTGYFGCTADYLLGTDVSAPETGKKFVDRYVRSFSEDENELLEAYKKLSEKQRELLIKAAKSWL